MRVPWHTFTTLHPCLLAGGTCSSADVSQTPPALRRALAVADEVTQPLPPQPPPRQLEQQHTEQHTEQQHYCGQATPAAVQDWSDDETVASEPAGGGGALAELAVSESEGDDDNDSSGAGDAGGSRAPEADLLLAAAAALSPPSQHQGAAASGWPQLPLQASTAVASRLRLAHQDWSDGEGDDGDDGIAECPSSGDCPSPPAGRHPAQRAAVACTPSRLSRS